MYVYCLVRSDLPLSQQVVQACHASHQAGRFLLLEDPPNLIVLSVEDEASLLDAAQRAQGHGIRLTVFREPDRGNEATAFCTEPVQGAARKIFQRLPLWKKEAVPCPT